MFNVQWKGAWQQMRKKIAGIIMSNCLIIGTLLGCVAKEDDSPDAITASENVEELEAESDFVENSDYSSYLNKIWCMNGENLDEEVTDNDVPVSLVITQIEEGSIQGYFDDTAYVYARYFRLSQKIG